MKPETVHEVVKEILLGVRERFLRNPPADPELRTMQDAMVTQIELLVQSPDTLAAFVSVAAMVFAVQPTFLQMVLMKVAHVNARMDQKMNELQGGEQKAFEKSFGLKLPAVIGKIGEC